MQVHTTDFEFRFPFTEYLESIAKSSEESLKKKVATDVLEYPDNPHVFFNDLLTNGCVSGMIPDLIYYKDTRAFYSKYYHEIETLREEYKEMTGVSIVENCDGDLQNFLAWFAYEETARRILDGFETR